MYAVFIRHVANLMRQEDVPIGEQHLVAAIHTSRPQPLVGIE